MKYVLFILSTVVFVSSLVTYSILYFNNVRNKTVITTPSVANNLTLDEINLKDFLMENQPIVIGNRSAKVAIFEFYDPACPFSQMYYENTFPKIYENYIKTGKILYVDKEYPLVSLHGINAFKAAQYLRCVYVHAGEDAYLRAKNLTYLSKRKWYDAKGVNLTKALLNIYLDTEKIYNDIVDCYLNNETASATYYDVVKGRQLGVRGTPSFIIYVPRNLLSLEDKVEIEDHFNQIYNVTTYQIYEDRDGNYIIPLIGALPYSEFKFVLSRVLPS